MITQHNWHGQAYTFYTNTLNEKVSLQGAFNLEYAEIQHLLRKVE